MILNMLLEITILNIDYLSYLDYIDYTSLSNTNKELHKLLNNDNVLRNILYKRCNDDIYLPSNFQITKALTSLYNEITSFIYKLYPDDIKWPRWINIEIFRNDIKRNVYLDLYNKIIDVCHEVGKDLSNVNIYNMKTIILTQVELIFPFAAYNDDIYLCNSDIDKNKFYKHFNRELHLSDIVLDYFSHTLLYLINKNERFDFDVEDKILDLLFIRDYTYKSLLEV